MTTDELQKWTTAHAGCDAAQLMLLAGHDKEKRDAATQIIARRKAAAKIPELLAFREFRFPTLLSSEQCTSQALARYHASLIDKRALVADLTTGLGIDSIYIARRAAAVTSVEINPEIADTFRHNISALGIGNITAINADSMQWLAEPGGDKQFDYIFIDPYRRDEEMGRVYTLESSRPDVIGNLNLLLSHCSTLIIKASPMLDCSLAISQLKGHARRVITLGTDKECKELLIIADKDMHADPLLEAVTILDETAAVTPISSIECTTSELAEAPATAPRNPEAGAILYEPYPSVMKAGLYRIFPSPFGMAPIAPNTHLFVADSHHAEISCRAFRILRVIPFNKRSCKELAAEFTHLNVATRNFPMKAPELEKRLKIKPGGTNKIYGVTLADGSKALILAEPISQTCGL